MPTASITYVALLRGINVGGNKKVPMADLKKMLEKKMGFTNVRTLLASGNVLFDAAVASASELTHKLETQLHKTFGFEVPVILRTLADIQKIAKKKPFKGINITPETRLYITFLGENSKKSTLKIPYESPGKDFTILRASGSEVCSVLTLNPQTRSVDVMGVLEKEFGKNVTTRNWNTVEKILKL